MFADGLLDNFAGNLHEVTLLAGAFRHESIMPEFAKLAKPPGFQIEPLPEYWALRRKEKA